MNTARPHSLGQCYNSKKSTPSSFRMARPTTGNMLPRLLVLAPATLPCISIKRHTTLSFPWRVSENSAEGPELSWEKWTGCRSTGIDQASVVLGRQMGLSEHSQDRWEWICPSFLNTNARARNDTHDTDGTHVIHIPQNSHFTQGISRYRGNMHM